MKIDNAKKTNSVTTSKRTIQKMEIRLTELE